MNTFFKYCFFNLIFSPRFVTSQGGPLEKSLGESHQVSEKFTLLPRAHYWIGRRTSTQEHQHPGFLRQTNDYHWQIPTCKSLSWQQYRSEFLSQIKNIQHRFLNPAARGSPTYLSSLKQESTLLSEVSMLLAHVKDIQTSWLALYQYSVLTNINSSWGL